jgi:5-dehydro-4-deoxyglucarate dehydratase
MADQQALAARLSTGILAFPATPFTADGALDTATLEDHVAAIAANKPIALVPAGGAGELFSLDVEEHEQVIRTTIAASSGLPVIAGIGGGLAIARQQARNAERAGADGVLLLPPYLVNSEQAGLAAYVRAVAASTSLPLIVYSRDNGIFRVDTLLLLADSCPTLIGVKDGTGDLDLVLETRRRTLGRLLLINGAPTAEMLAAQTLAIGVTAYSSAVFAFAPAIAQAFYDAVVAGNRARQDALLSGFYFPYSAIRRRRAGNAVSIVKAGLKVTGKSAGPVRAPLLDLDDGDCAELAALIANGTAITHEGHAA